MLFTFSVLDFESEIMYDSETDTLKEYTSCLHVHDMVVMRHMQDDPTDLKTDSAIPFTVNIFERAFPSLDKAEVGEKDESDQDEEDGK